MSKTESIIDRRRRRRAYQVTKEAEEIRSLNAYTRGNPDFELKEGLLVELLGKDNAAELEIPLKELAKALTINARISSAQKDMLYIIFASTGVFPYEGDYNSKDPARLNTNSNGDLQTTSLVNVSLARETSEDRDQLDLLASTFNNAHMAAERARLYLYDHDGRTKAGRAVSHTLGQAFEQRHHTLDYLVGRKVVTPVNAEMLAEVTTPEQLLLAPQGDYLIVVPFKDPIIQAGSLTEAFRRTQDLIYFGVALGMKELSVAERKASELRAEDYRARKWQPRKSVLVW